MDERLRPIFVHEKRKNTPLSVSVIFRVKDLAVSDFTRKPEEVLFVVIFHIADLKPGRARISEYNSQRGKRHQPSKAIINLNGHAY